MASKSRRATVSAASIPSLSQAAKAVSRSKTSALNAADEVKPQASTPRSEGGATALNQKLRVGFLRKTYQQTRIALALQKAPTDALEDDPEEEDVETDAVQQEPDMPLTPESRGNSKDPPRRQLSKGWCTAAAILKGTGKAIDHSKSLIQKVRQVAKAAYDRHSIQKQMMDELKDNYSERLQVLAPCFDEDIEDILQDVAALQVDNMVEIGELIVDGVMNNTSDAELALQKLRDRLIDATQDLQRDMANSAQLEGQMASILNKVALLKAQLMEAAASLGMSAQQQRAMRRGRSFKLVEEPAKEVPQPPQQTGPAVEESQELPEVKRRSNASNATLEEPPPHPGTRPSTSQMLLSAPQRSSWTLLKSPSPIISRSRSPSPFPQLETEARAEARGGSRRQSQESAASGFPVVSRTGSMSLVGSDAGPERLGSESSNFKRESVDEEKVVRRGLRDRYARDAEATVVEAKDAMPSRPSPAAAAAEISRPGPSSKVINAPQFGDLDLPPLEPEEYVLAEPDDDFDMIVIGRSPRRKPPPGKVPKLRFPALPMFPQQETPRSTRSREFDPFASCRSVEKAATGTFPAMEHSVSRGTLASAPSSARLPATPRKKLATAQSDRLGASLSSGFTRRPQALPSWKWRQRHDVSPVESGVINWFHSPPEPGAPDI